MIGWAAHRSRWTAPVSWILNTTKIGTAPAAQPSSGWNGCTYGKFRSTEGQLGKQKRSPWLLILRLHSCVVFVCACIRHYFPRRQGNHLNRGWLHRVMGVSPPAGSLSAALLAWSPFRWGLGLDGSIIVPDGVVAIQLAIGCFVDGRIRLAPYLAVVDRCGQPGCKNRTN